MGLIASGSLLICCNKAASNDLLEKFAAADITATCIGEVLDPGRGIAAFEVPYVVAPAKTGVQKCL